MRSRKLLLSALLYSIIVLLTYQFIFFACKGQSSEPKYELILSATAYQDSAAEPIWTRLYSRIKEQPFNLIALSMFLLAIVHTFCARFFNTLSQELKRKLGSESFSVEFFRFMGEVEVVFGIWVIPLLIGMTWYYDWPSALNYLNNRNYTEPLFVVVIMAVASSGPILALTEDGLRYIAKIRRQSVTSWWWTILTVGPLLGSFITEPGAMTIVAQLLAKQFYTLRPSKKLAYATLGLLFVNISVGGVLTCFAAPPVLMVSRVWGWDSLYMFNRFGFKAIIAIVLSNLCYYLMFRSEFKELEKKKQSMDRMKQEKSLEVPLWISLIHVAFLAWIVVHAQFPVVTIGSFLLFLGFYQATLPHQKQLNLKTPVLVGFFLAGLVVHGSLQGWWISVLLENSTEGVLMVFSTILTAFNDNAEITFLSTLIPDLSESMKYAIMAGAVTGGGLTVIANAPNPAGQAILSSHFSGGVSALRLFVGAVLPTLLTGLCLYFIKNV